MKFDLMKSPNLKHTKYFVWSHTSLLKNQAKLKVPVHDTLLLYEYICQNDYFVSYSSYSDVFLLLYSFNFVLYMFAL